MRQILIILLIVILSCYDCVSLKTSICTKTEHVFISKTYEKSICYVKTRASFYKANNFCRQNGMEIYDPTSSNNAFLTLKYLIRSLKNFNKRKYNFLKGNNGKKCLGMNGIGQLGFVNCKNGFPFVCEYRDKAFTTTLSTSTATTTTEPSTTTTTIPSTTTTTIPSTTTTTIPSTTTTTETSTTTTTEPSTTTTTVPPTTTTTETSTTTTTEPSTTTTTETSTTTTTEPSTTTTTETSTTTTTGAQTTNSSTTLTTQPQVDWCSLPSCEPNSHINCNNDGEFASVCESPRSFVLTSAHISRLIDEHNIKRNKIATGNVAGFPTARRMAKLVWNNQLAEFAALNTKKCQMEHDKCRNTLSFDLAGQNLFEFSTTGTYTTTEVIRDAVSSWFSEWSDATAENIDEVGTPSNGVIGHFTAIVTDRTTQIGCAISAYTSGGWTNYLCACNYASTNVDGWPVYKRGPTASACVDGPDVDYPGLCKTSEKIDPNSNDN